MVTYTEHRNDTLPRADTLPMCPVETFVKLMGNKWRPLILRDLLVRPMRFGELQRSVGGISQKVLTANLRELEERGIVARRVYPEVPPHVEYALTDLGRSMEPVIDAMSQWGTRYQRLVREGSAGGAAHEA